MSTKRNSTELKVWMIRNSLREVDIVRATKVPQTHVCKTINGTRNSRIVLAYLLERGCPRELLALPRDMEKGNEQSR